MTIMLHESKGDELKFYAEKTSDNELNVISLVPFELVEKIAFIEHIEKWNCRIVNLTLGSELLYDVSHAVLNSIFPPVLHMRIRNYLRMPKASPETFMNSEGNK